MSEVLDEGPFFHKANPVVVGGVVRGTWARRSDDLAVTWLEESPPPVEEIEHEAVRLGAILGQAAPPRPPPTTTTAPGGSPRWTVTSSTACTWRAPSRASPRSSPGSTATAPPSGSSPSPHRPGWWSTWPRRSEAGAERIR
ncbi:hypothetical protein NOCARDAX2BIS_250046 [Nocardioides sp. AX2bis]|nr:hypothetical protein NOCARDAX2BIS_250046 [Nocardioides sp. AX2bis]